MIEIVGLGPGAKEYILPVAINRIREADLVIGGTRNLRVVAEYTHTTMNLSSGFKEVGNYIKEHQEAAIVIVVSGDTGFYSMLAFTKRYVEDVNIKMIPGISSLQYFYSRLSLSYEKSRWLSLHGRETKLDDYIEAKEEMAILTDKEHNTQFIAGELIKHGVEDATLYIGERLSYPDEKISCLSVKEALVYEAHALSVVVVRYE